MPLQHIVARPDRRELLEPYGTIFPVTPDDQRIPIPLNAAGLDMRGDFTATVIRAPSANSLALIDAMERHLYSVQAFVPLGACQLVALAATRGAAPRWPDQITAIHIPAGWGWAWHPGVWHSGMMGNGIDAALVSMVRRLPDGSDTQTAALPFSLETAELHLHVD